MSLIQFGHPKCILLIIITAITKIINQIIMNHCQEYFNPFFDLFLMFIGESLSIFFYLYQRYNKRLYRNNKFKIKKKNIHYFLSLLFSFVLYLIFYLLRIILVFSVLIFKK